MSGGAGDVVATEDDLRTARFGTMLQLDATTNLASEYGDGNIEAAIDALGMREFIENSIQVKAQYMAWMRALTNQMNQMEERHAS